jgi:hypothetical protein
MRRRCKVNTRPGYKYYGGRGITVCKQWATFASFAADMGPHPGRGWSLDRVNNNGHYCRSNCRWGTKSEQTRNRNYTKLTPDIAVIIRRLYTKGHRWKPEASATCGEALAIQFGVSKQLVSDIVHGKIWK